MAKSLVIVESPAKAKTINRYLGSDFIVKSSVGHIRDLPTSGSGTPVDAKARAKEAARTRQMEPKQKAAHKRRKQQQQLVARMGVDPEHGWQANYEILPGKEKVVRELRQAAEKADTVYLATDLDREGEAIAWHLREAIGGDPSRYKRVVFNEITRKAIQEAFAEPGEVDIDRVNAQQARRFLDRVVGYMLSPLLWQKVARGLSAGRVQSVAVRLLVEREREIRAFVPEEYWEVFANLAREGTVGEVVRARFQVAKEKGETFRPGDKATTDAALAKLDAESFNVTNREDKPTSTRPGAPFITSTLQQAASTRLGFSVKKTMTLAQRLYEAGYITYMRTDSTNLSQDAVEACRSLIRKDYGERYLPENPVLYASRDKAQEAHEAIRPSDVNVRMERLSDMERDAVRLYELIWRQFVACQMPRAEYTSTTITVTAGDFELKLRGRILRFDGYTRVQPLASRGDDDHEVPDLQVGEALRLIKLDPFQHFTKPPPRYGEASLVRELEKRGIGRPSTYASIISTIQERGYVSLRNRRFFAEKVGDVVTDRLVENFDNLLDYDFTAKMEERLDTVAKGELNWTTVLDEFYEDFRTKLDVAAQQDGGMRPNAPTDTDIDCPACGRKMQLRTASTGVFLGCSGYALPPKERCTQTLNLIPGEEAVDLEADEESESKALRRKHRCPKCGTSMESYLLDETRKLHVCGNNPDCDGFEVEPGEYRIKGYEGPTLECDKCGAEMQLKSGRFGKYFGCTECKNTRKLLRSGQPAPPKMDPVPMPELACEKVDDTYVLRDGAAGLFLAASKFPKNRETRAPLVRELKPHKDEIDPKWHFVLEAPETDPDGNPTMLRWSRKLNEQYVMTEKDGKPTGWRAVYADGRWQETDADAPRKSGGKKATKTTKTGKKAAGSKAAGGGR
ncbi:MAG: type I DNA topoisomerase [Gammaproteobacteria bacterium]|nr:type I DNA topoisomerase [Gammaproteobacteria bacterium]